MMHPFYCLLAETNQSDEKMVQRSKHIGFLLAPSFSCFLDGCRIDLVLPEAAWERRVQVANLTLPLPLAISGALTRQGRRNSSCGTTEACRRFNGSRNHASDSIAV